MLVHAHNPSMWEAEAGGIQVQDQFGLYSKMLPKKNNNKTVM
jgi:hypothetical protein